MKTVKLCEICGRYYEKTMIGKIRHEDTKFHKNKSRKEKVVQLCPICHVYYSIHHVKRHIESKYHLKYIADKKFDEFNKIVDHTNFLEYFF